MYIRVKYWLKEHIREGSVFWGVLRHCKNMAKYIVTFKPGKLYAYVKREFLEKNSIFIFEEELSMASLLPRGILDRTVELMAPGSILDLGCGVGRSLDYFLSKGIDAVGVEGSALAISKALHPERIIKYNLEKELKLDRKFDLVWSFEFVEHVRPMFLDNLMRTFSNHSDKIVMSAARPGQRGDGHFNEQPEGYWIEQFRKYGYVLDGGKTETLRGIGEIFAENMLVFERK